MSQVFENANVIEADIDPGPGRGDQHPYPSAQTQELRGMSNFVDGSGPIFSMYLEMATEEDKKMVEGWKADADGILIFTGLFSAAVASLISVSIQDIRPNPQDTSNFYLANIYHTLADPPSNISTSLPASPPSFSPPKYAVWVNTLLFLSLVISISCALLATLLQQWARRYLKVTQPRYSPHRRARIRAFFFEGVEKFLLPWAVEALPTLLHVSLFLFFAGISVFLRNIDLTIFNSVVSWIGICTALYGCITFVPIFHHDSPYHTPLSLPAWHIVVAISFVTFRVLRCFSLIRFAQKAHDRFESLEGSYRKLLLQDMQKTVETTALDSPSEIDTRAFLWTFDSLDEDHELERFFSGLPGFRSSKVVNDPLPRLTWEQTEKLSTALMGLFDRAFSSDLLPESVKIGELSSAREPLIQHCFPSNMIGCRGLQTSKFGCIVRGWGKDGNQGTALITQAIVTNIVVGVQQRDDSWFTLTSSALGVPESDLRDYAPNSLSLAILIHVVRQQFDHFGKPFWPSSGFWDVLSTASQFDVQDTSPELQHKFCALWNEIVRKVQNDDNRLMGSRILRWIRNVYMSLHQDTNSAPTQFSASTDDWDDILEDLSSYPVCNVAGHIHEVSALTTFICTVPHDDAALIPASLASTDVHCSSMPHPLHVLESLDVPPVGDDTYVTGSIHPAHQTAIENPRIPSTSPDLVTAQAIQGGVHTTTTIPSSTPGTFFPTSKATGTVHIRYTAERRTFSDRPDFPSSPSPTPILDDMLQTESHSRIPAPVTPGTSRRWLSSVPDLGVAAEGDGSAEVSLHEEKDAIYPLLLIRENTMSTPELPSQSPLPQSDNDVAIAGPSQRSLVAEHTGDLLHPSHGQYDIV
ncbi:hypothetical protein EDB85DRAFT_2278440 [Lactarius pseudohatsudake]|nr:hypothetical protein EDB85DRAFT_2278440 [Lactarius pseudohatsudake]